MARRNVEELIKRIRPLIEVKGNHYEVTNIEDLDSSDFYESPKIGAKIEEKLDAVRISLDFMTRHAFISEQEFKPTLREILLQIPEEVLERVSYFCVEGKIQCCNNNGSLLYWAGLVELLGPSRIPEISDEELSRRADLVQAIVFKKGGEFFIKEPDLRDVAFTWNPKFSEDATGLVEVQRITTYHTYGSQALFKPSIAEVLAQLPADFEGRVTAFSVQGPKDAADLNKHKQELDEGYHVSETILYGPAA